MNICIFTKYLSSDAKSGGVESHVEDLIEYLASQKHSVTVITSQGSSLVSEHPLITVLQTEVRVTSNPITRLRYFRQSQTIFKKLLTERKIDIAHSQSNFAYGCLKQLLKHSIPLITTAHGTTINELKSIARNQPAYIIPWIVLMGLYWPIEAHIYWSSCKVIAVSPELAIDIHRQLFVPKRKIVTICNGVDTEEYRPSRRSHAEFTAITVGSLTKQKGMHIAIQALAAMVQVAPRTKLVIVGSGPDEVYFRTLASDLGVAGHVEFTGRLSRRDVRLKYREANIFVFPTLREEGLPYVMLEAMACGLPVISTGVGGIASLVSNGITGLLVKMGDVNQLAQQCLMVFQENSLAERLARNARESIMENYSKTSMIHKTMFLYKAQLGDE